MKTTKIDHLALILDGNRRWGKQRGIMMNIDFYVQSGLLGRDIAQAAFDHGIDHLTIWIGSMSNLTKRPAIEIKALNKAYKKFFTDKDNLEFAHERRIKIDCFGRWRELLEPGTVKAIEKTLAATADYTDSGKRLTVLIGYDGTDERGAAIENIVRSDDDFSQLSGTKDFAKLLRDNSWTGHLPDVDLLIRTGCADDPHNSAGFLSLLVDNAQYAFIETLWPDFTPEMLAEIIDDFDNRERRLGK
jgi:undecaprenyl diphosphate synthase